MPQNVTSATSAGWIQVKSIVISSLDFVQLVIICKHITEINPDSDAITMRKTIISNQHLCLKTVQIDIFQVKQ